MSISTACVESVKRTIQEPPATNTVATPTSSAMGSAFGAVALPPAKMMHHGWTSPRKATSYYNYIILTFQRYRLPFTKLLSLGLAWLVCHLPI